MPDTATQATLILKGNGDDSDDFWDALRRWRDRGHAIDVRVTSEPGDAERFAAEAAAAGALDVLVAGGDGTIHGVVRGLLGGGETTAGGRSRLPALGIIPRGTGNDFAAALGVPDAVQEAFAIALSGSVRDVDVGWVGDHPVVNVATGGFATEVTVDTPEQLKDALGRVSYLLTGIQRLSDFRAEPVTVRTAQGEWSGSMVALAVGNARRAGGNVTICADARIDDGLLDVTVIPGEGEGFGDALGMLIEGGIDWRSLCTHFRSPWVELEAPEGLSLNIDGEPFEIRELRFEVRPGALRLRVPECSPLLGCEED